MSNRLSPEKAKEQPITAQQADFIDFYCNNGYNGTQAAKLAKYNGSNKVLGITACRLLAKDIIKVAVEAKKVEIKEEKAAISQVSPTYVRMRHLRLAKECHQKGDYANETANLKLYGQTGGIYVDTVNTADTTQKAEIAAMAEAERINLRRIAGIRLQEMVKEA